MENWKIQEISRNEFCKNSTKILDISRLLQICFARVLLYKSLFFTRYPIYMRNMFTFTLWDTSYILCGNYILTLHVHRTNTYSLHSFSFHAAKQWNLLQDSVKTNNFADYKRILTNIDMQT